MRLTQLKVKLDDLYARYDINKDGKLDSAELHKLTREGLEEMRLQGPHIVCACNILCFIHLFYKFSPHHYHSFLLLVNRLIPAKRSCWSW
jgi:hypothetical protein